MYNYGARNANRVKKTYKLLLSDCPAYSTMMWAAVMMFPRLFISVFTRQAALIAFASKVLRIYFVGMPLLGIQIVCYETFVSLGAALLSVIVAMVRKFILLLPILFPQPLLRICAYSHSKKRKIIQPEMAV